MFLALPQKSQKRQEKEDNNNHQERMSQQGLQIPKSSVKRIMKLNEEVNAISQVSAALCLVIPAGFLGAEDEQQLVMDVACVVADGTADVCVMACVMVQDAVVAMCKATVSEHCLFCVFAFVRWILMRAVWGGTGAVSAEDCGAVVQGVHQRWTQEREN
jgi:hypothetical protein